MYVVFSSFEEALTNLNKTIKLKIGDEIKTVPTMFTENGAYYLVRITFYLHSKIYICFIYKKYLFIDKQNYVIFVYNHFVLSCINSDTLYNFVKS